MAKVEGMMLKQEGRWYASVSYHPGVHPCTDCDLRRLCRGFCHDRRLLNLCSELLGATSGKFCAAGLDDILSTMDRMSGL